MCKWPKRVNVPPTVLYFNVGEVYNLVYYTALWKDLIIQASIHMKIFAFMDEDILLIEMLNVASLVLPISNHLKKTCSSHISAIIKTYVGFHHHSGQRAISTVDWTRRGPISLSVKPPSLPFAAFFCTVSMSIYHQQNAGKRGK